MNFLLTKPTTYLLWIISLILFTSHAYGETVIYLYDEYGQLQEAQYEEHASITYDYDSIGNRLTRTVTPTRGSAAMKIDSGTPLSTLKKYAYTNTGPYSGIFTSTEESGKTVLNPDNFQLGTYLFRNNYLSDLR